MKFSKRVTRFLNSRPRKSLNYMSLIFNLLPFLSKNTARDVRYWMTFCNKRQLRSMYNKLRVTV